MSDNSLCRLQFLYLWSNKYNLSISLLSPLTGLTSLVDTSHLAGNVTFLPLNFKIICLCLDYLEGYYTYGERDTGRIHIEIFLNYENLYLLLFTTKLNVNLTKIMDSH